MGLHDRLTPLIRPGHRAKTVGRWQVRHPEPGTLHWRSPYGRVYLVTNQGTTPLANGPLAHAVWRAASGVRRTGEVVQVAV